MQCHGRFIVLWLGMLAWHRLLHVRRQGIANRPYGFFARGVFSAVNWIKLLDFNMFVLMSLHVPVSAVRLITIPARESLESYLMAFPCICRVSFNAQYGKCMQAVASRMVPFLHFQGQLLYYVQAVD